MLRTRFIDAELKFKKYEHILERKGGYRYHASEELIEGHNSIWIFDSPLPYKHYALNTQRIINKHTQRSKQ